MGNPNFTAKYTVDTGRDDVNVVDSDFLGKMYNDLINKRSTEVIDPTNKASSAARYACRDTWAGAQALSDLMANFASRHPDHEALYNPDIKVLAFFSLENDTPTFGVFIDANKLDKRAIFGSSYGSIDS